MIFSKLKELREYEAKTQVEIAEVLQVQRSTYAGWECGKDIIPLRKLNLFANHFKTSLDYLIGLKPNEIISHFIDVNVDVSAKNIKTLRKELNLSQDELAKSINTSQANIHRYESGKALITTNYAITLAKKYNYSLDKLAGRK